MDGWVGVWVGVGWAGRCIGVSVGTARPGCVCSLRPAVVRGAEGLAGVEQELRNAFYSRVSH